MNLQENQARCFADAGTKRVARVFEEEDGTRGGSEGRGGEGLSMISKYPEGKDHKGVKFTYEETKARFGI